MLDHYSGKTVLITGASGFLGRHLAARLAEITRCVRCVSRRDVNLGDADATLDLFAKTKPEIVFHLASASGGSTGIDNVLPHLHDDINTTVNCLVAAQKVGVERFVIPGSTDETLPGAVPESPYAMAKATCVRYGQMFHRLYGTPTVTCRIFMTYGPGQKPRKIVPYIVRSMLSGESPSVASPDRLVDWIHVDDAIEAILLSGITPGIAGETIDVGSGRLVSIGDLAAMIQGMIPKAPPITSANVPPFGGVREADLAPGQRLLGWTPRVALPDGLASTIEWYRSAE
jgi:UDP-glucose 4-epimerase